MSQNEQNSAVRIIDDISNASFEEFIDCLFVHKLSDWVNFNPLRTINFYIRLFNDSTILFGKFSREQLEGGFWTIQSPALDLSMGYLIGDPNIPLELRLACIKTTYDLFKDFFSVDILVNSGSMWWDCVLDTYKSKFRQGIVNDSEDGIIRSTIFETLSQMLKLASLDCQGAALHGLGHLHHPDTEQVIMTYLETHPELDEEMQDFALDCITGDIM